MYLLEDVRFGIKYGVIVSALLKTLASYCTEVVHMTSFCFQQNQLLFKMLFCICTRTLDHFLLYTFSSVLERAKKMFKARYQLKFYANFATTKYLIYLTVIYSIGIYGKYLMTPYVIFLKTQFMQLTFIGLFFRISMIGSSIAPTVEESFIFIFFIGFVLSEIQQYRSSASKVYLR